MKLTTSGKPECYGTGLVHRDAVVNKMRAAGDADVLQSEEAVFSTFRIVVAQDICDIFSFGLRCWFEQDKEYILGGSSFNQHTSGLGTCMK